MKNSLKIILVICCVIGIVSEKNNYAGPSGSVVYDGRNRLVIIPDQVVEFAATENYANTDIKTIDSSALVITRNGLVKIWQLKNSALTRSLQKGGLPMSLQGNFSAVFLDASGKKKALPGNVIVYMDKKWDQDKVYAWAQSLELTVVKCISAYNNIYVIQSRPGIASLNLANTLRNKDGVQKVMPNWWTPVYRR